MFKVQDLEVEGELFWQRSSVALYISLSEDGSNDQLWFNVWLPALMAEATVAENIKLKKAPSSPSPLTDPRLNSIDVKYQIWKLGVVFTDNVSTV